MDKSKIYTNSKDEWYTPKLIIDYVNSLGNKITYDPATTKEQAIRLDINEYSDKKDDGLSKISWQGHVVWLNPPFSNKEEWIAKARLEVQKGNCKVFILLPVALETKVMHKYILGNCIIHIPNGRIAFINEKGNGGKSPAFTSAIFEITREPSNTYKLFDIKKEDKYEKNKKNNNNN